MKLVHDHTLTAGELIPTMRVNMPYSYRQLFIEAVFATQGNRVLVIGLPDGPPYGDAKAGLSDEQLDERRTYIEFKADDPVVAHYLTDEIDHLAGHRPGCRCAEHDRLFEERLREQSGQ